MLKISVLRFTYEARVFAVFSLFAPGAGNIDVKSNGTSSFMQTQHTDNKKFFSVSEQTKFIILKSIHRKLDKKNSGNKP